MEPRCVLVTNASAEGVQLQLNSIEPGDEFVLLFHGNGGEARDGTYELIWRHGAGRGRQVHQRRYAEHVTFSRTQLASRSLTAPSRSTETSCDTPRSAMVTP